MYDDSHIAKLVYDSLAIKNDESIGLIYDKHFSVIADRIFTFCTKRGIEISKVYTDFSSDNELEKQAKEILINDQPEIVILALKNNAWHTKERRTAKHIKRKRLANILNPEVPSESYGADVNSLIRLGKQIKSKLDVSNSITIKTSLGTNLVARIGKPFCETGDYSRPGTGGDFPAGEVGFGPVEFSVNGRIVFDFKIQYFGFAKNNNQIVEIERDYIKSICTDPNFMKVFDSHKALRYLSEISIGINPIWVESDNPICIVEEKNRGTIHFGFGGNLSYGNRKGPHLDGVILNPTIYLDNNLLMENGKFNDNYLNN